MLVGRRKVPWIKLNMAAVIDARSLAAAPKAAREPKSALICDNPNAWGLLKRENKKILKK